MKLSDFMYDLPEERIAQTPVEPRDHSRLMVLHRDTHAIEHRHFYDVIDYLNPGDVLVVNETKVIPARLYGERPTGGAVEVLLLKQLGPKRWETLVRPGKKLKPGAEVIFGDGRLTCRVLETTDVGGRIVEFQCEGSFEAALDALGEMPLPPYITEKLTDCPCVEIVHAVIIREGDIDVDLFTLTIVGRDGWFDTKGQELGSILSRFLTCCATNDGADFYIITLYHTR